MKYRIWYSDYSISIASFEEWSTLPDGIEGVVVYEDKETPAGFPYRILVSGGDWYWWDGGNIFTDSPNYLKGTWNDRPIELCSSCIKQSGLWLDDVEWNRIRYEMMRAKTWR